MLVQLSFSINFLRWLKTVVWTMIKNFLEWQGNIFIKLILIWLTIIVIQSIIFLPIFCGVAQLYFLFKLTSSFTFTGNCNPQKILFKRWLNNIGENFLEWYRNKDITKFTNIIKSYSDQFSSALLLSLSQSYILFNGWHPWLQGCKYTILEGCSTGCYISGMDRIGWVVRGIEPLTDEIWFVMNLLLVKNLLCCYSICSPNSLCILFCKSQTMSDIRLCNFSWHRNKTIWGNFGNEWQKNFKNLIGEIQSRERSQSLSQR